MAIPALESIIDALNKSCGKYFTESTFVLTKKSFNRYVVSGNSCSKALNNYNNESQEVTVVKWFNDFWIYVDIKFRFKDKGASTAFPDIFISLSIFQGNPADSKKNQLFRAEWDNYRNPDEHHPQPHWHVYPTQYDHQSFGDLLKTLKDDEDSFTALLDDTKSKFIDIKRIHFAMNGQWSSQGSHVHEINNEETIINWFYGVLGCIKAQLEYVS